MQAEWTAKVGSTAAAAAITTAAAAGIVALRQWRSVQNVVDGRAKGISQVFQDFKCDG